jgi:hypothetical protein
VATRTPDQVVAEALGQSHHLSVLVSLARLVSGKPERWVTIVASSTLLSCSSSAWHLRLAAFLVRLAGGEATLAGEGASGGVDAGGDVAVGRGAPRTGGATGLAAVVSRTRLCWCQRSRTSAGVRASEGGTLRRQDMEISWMPAWWQKIMCVRRPESMQCSYGVRKSFL